MNHYVYQITDIETEQYYIGVRSCEIEPYKDIPLHKNAILHLD